jgi:hypothetical protein
MDAIVLEAVVRDVAVDRCGSTSGPRQESIPELNCSPRASFVDDLKASIGKSGFKAQIVFMPIAKHRSAAVPYTIAADPFPGIMKELDHAKLV